MSAVTDFERELREAMSAMVADAEPPPAVMERVRRRHRRRNAWLAATGAALAVVVVIGTVGLIRAFSPAPGRPRTVAQGQATRFVDPLFGWSIRVAAGLEARHFEVSCLHGPVAGVRVTSFPPNLRAQSNEAPPMGWLRSFPADGVAVQIWYGCSLAFLPPSRDSAFPLSPSSFHRIRPYVGGQEPRPWFCDCHGDGIGFVAAVWIGPHASRAERHAAWAVVRSLRFPALREGTIYPAPRAVSTYGDSYYVLGQASRYPTGSVTTFPVVSLPGNHWASLEGFYLIHAPRAFYVIPKVFQESAKPFTSCTVTFDPKRFQFYCPGTALRWNRGGYPIGAHAGSGDWDLRRFVATVAQDGHILVRPLSR